MEIYRKICFLGIPRYLNVVPNDLRDKATKFTSNNTISGEKHLINFTDMLNEYEL